MRTIAAVVLAMTITVTGAFAADTGPLAAGKPAGAKQAQLETGGVLLVVGILAVAGAIAAIASTTQGKGGGGSSTTTTTTG
jgi:hypothetical protein